MAGRLVVDLGGLSALDGELNRIVTTLRDQRDRLDAYDESLGDSRVRDALHGFEHHWRDGRKHLADSGQSLADMLGDAVRTFRDADHKLAASITEAMRAGDAG